MFVGEDDELGLVRLESAFVPKALEREGDEVRIVVGELETRDVVRPGLVGAVQATERVAQVDVGHRPFGREADGDVAFLETRVAMPSRAPHYRIVEVGFGVPRYGFLSTLPQPP